jgi:hypothetical protein
MDDRHELDTTPDSERKSLGLQCSRYESGLHGLDGASAAPGTMRVKPGDVSAVIDSVEAVPGQAGPSAIHFHVPNGIDFGAVPIEAGVSSRVRASQTGRYEMPPGKSSRPAKNLSLAAQIGSASYGFYNTLGLHGSSPCILRPGIATSENQ